MKKLINRPGDVVDEMIEGLVSASPYLKRLKDYNVIVRADCTQDEVDIYYYLCTLFMCIYLFLCVYVWRCCVVRLLVRQRHTILYK